MSYQLYQLPDNNQEEHQPTIIDRLDITWIGANNQVSILTDESLGTRFNYYNTTSPKGITNVPTYGGITYKNLYPGIDLHYYYKNGELKYDFLLQPFANPDLIRIKIAGASSIDFNEANGITISTPHASLREGLPEVYQGNLPVLAKWHIDGDVISFKLEKYNRALPITIDPLVYRWDTNWGSGPSGSTWGRYTTLYNARKDKAGNCYGTLISSIGTGGGPGTGTYTRSLFKLSPSGQLTPPGGGFNAFNVFEETSDVDSAGNLILAGRTIDPNLATAGAYQTTLAGGYDIFVKKHDSAGNLIWCTYFGGQNSENANSCVLDEEGNLYVAGGTSSTSGIASPTGYQQTFGGGADIFWVKFNQNGQRIWSSYFGGTQDEAPVDIVYTSGKIALAGYTTSSNNIATPGSHQPIKIGIENNGFLVLADTAGTVLWATYYGGDSTKVMGCSFDATGSVVIAGTTSSSTAISSASSSQPVYGGMRDGFIARFNQYGQRQFGTYLGGTLSDVINDVSSADDGRIYVCGNAESASGIITPNAATTFGNTGFIAEYDSSGVKQYATYIANTWGTIWPYSCVVINDALYILGRKQVGNTNEIGYATRFDRCQPNNATITGLDKACAGDSVLLSVPPVGTSFIWRRIGSNLPLSSNANSIWVKQSGSYTVWIDSCPGAVSAPFQVTFSLPPTVNSSVRHVPCYGEPNGSIYLSVSGGLPPYSYTWTGVNINGPAAVGLGIGTYSVIVEDTLGCKTNKIFTISQNNDSLPSTPLASICAVTVDSATGKNMVIWEKNGNVKATEYHIYRENSQSQDEFIATVDRNSFSVWVDTGSIPMQQSYRYKISELDSCGNEHPKSEAHKTIHLMANVGINGEINLNWNAYEGRQYTTYTILRSVNNAPFAAINAVSAGTLSFSDINPPSGNKRYAIEVNLSATCNPTARITSMGSVRSNQVVIPSNNPAETGNIQITPNPSESKIQITGTQPATTILIDNTGRSVLRVDKTTVINLNGIARGVYMLCLYDEAGRLYFQTKLIKL